MIIKAKAKPKASKECVKELSEDFYEVALRQILQKKDEDKANKW